MPKQHSGIEDLLRAADVQQQPKPITTGYPKIKLEPVQESDVSKPLDWTSAYERHAQREDK
jgi:hypothetical protein